MADSYFIECLDQASFCLQFVEDCEMAPRGMKTVLKKEIKRIRKEIDTVVLALRTVHGLTDSCENSK